MPRVLRSNRAKAAVWDDRAIFEEAFRVLRSNLTVALTDFERPTVIVTSANADEGKTVVASQLAVSFAQAGHRVVLVDMDLRHAGVHQLVGAHNEFGVAEVLMGTRSLESSLQYVDPPATFGRPERGMYFLAAGAAVQDTTELLGLGRTAQLLEHVADQADIVLIDSPPVLPVADTLVLGRLVSGALLVTETRRTAVTAVQRSKDLLIRNQTRLLGVVLNKVQPRDSEHGSGYGYARPLPGAVAGAGLFVDGAESNGHTNGHRNGNGRRPQESSVDSTTSANRWPIPDQE